MTRKRKRNYRAEYKRRVELALKHGYSRRVARGHPGKDEVSIRKAKILKVEPGSSIKKIVDVDRRYTFGERIHIEKGEHVTQYLLRLEEMAKRVDGYFDWTNERRFIEQMKALGLTEREAYGKLLGS